MMHAAHCLSFVFFAIAVFIFSQSVPAQTESAVMARIKHGRNTFFGAPLGWDGKQIAILERDGQLHLVPAKSRDDAVVVGDKFQPFKADELQQRLLGEYANRYDVSTTANFVVVHPWGDARIWAQPFEDFHDRFIRFFESHDIDVSPPKTPMIALVLRSRNDFNRSLINEVRIHDSRIGGFYSRITNRITTFDPEGYLRTGEDRWMYGSTSIIHEAAHQSAFNTGIHNRFAPPPKWLSEGLATMFESAGNSSNGKPQIGGNSIRLNQLRKHLGTDVIHPGLLNLVANDRMFRTHPELAYALSWGMSYYLIRTQPDKYFQFLLQDASRRNFTDYSSENRLRDFMSAFGHDFHQLEDELNEYFRQR